MGHDTYNMIDDLQKKLAGVQENIPLAPFTTFKIGGPAKYFFVANTSEDVMRALQVARELQIPYFILGGGSNILVSDKGFDGLVIQIKDSRLKIDGTKIIVGAGVTTALVAKATVDAGLTGLEWAIGVPGTIGGAVRGNAGCFGSEIKDVVEWVRVAAVGSGLLLRNYSQGSGVQDSQLQGSSSVPTADAPNAAHLHPSSLPVESSSSEGPRAGILRNPLFLKEDIVRKLNREECGFEYRSSKFKKEKGWVVLEVKLELQKGDKEKSTAIIKDILKQRAEKFPHYPSSGCMFKNVKFTPGNTENLSKKLATLLPQKFIEWGTIPTAWLLEELGLKGAQIGGAEISKDHCNFLVNSKNATAENVVMLISLVKQKARDEFGVQLEEEVQMVGFE